MMGNFADNVTLNACHAVRTDGRMLCPHLAPHFFSFTAYSDSLYLNHGNLEL